MIPVPTRTVVGGSVRAWLATGRTDMRAGFSSLAVLVQETLQQDPHCGHHPSSCTEELLGRLARNRLARGQRPPDGRSAANSLRELVVAA